MTVNMFPPSLVLLSSFDLIITNGLVDPTNGLTNTLVEFAALGGTVVVIPDSSNSSSRANYLRTQLGFGSGSKWNLSESPVSIGNLNVDHPLFDGVFSSTPKRMDLPSTDRCIARNISPDEEILGTMSSGLVFLSRIPVNKGGAFLFGSPLEKETGNLVNHALFVPILLRISEVSRSARVHAFTLGLDDALTLNFESNEEDEIRISSLDSSSVILPESRSSYGSTHLSLGPELDTPGNYFVEIDKAQVLAFGLNADRTESNPSAWDTPTFRQQLSSFGWSNASVLNVTNETISSVVGNLDTGNHLWWYLILVVIIALAGETILQKRWKRTYS